MKRIIIVGVALYCSIFQGKAQQYAKKIDSLINKAVILKRFNGTVLVSKNGKIVFEKAYGYQDIQNKIENTPTAIFQVGSMTKQFTATIVLKLAEQHKLSIDDKISKYFPTLKRGHEITIKNLLTHTSGLSEIFRDTLFIKENKQKHLSKEKLLSFFIDKPLYFDPGTQYSYCNSGYALLGLIIEKVSGKSYKADCKRFYFEALKNDA